MLDHEKNKKTADCTWGPCFPLRLYWQPKSAGPIGSFSDGSRKLNSYVVKGKNLPLSEASGRIFLNNDRTTSGDSVWFSFSDANNKITEYLICLDTEWDINKKGSIGYYWMKTKNGQKMRAVIYRDLPTGKQFKLELGGLIPTNGFSEADTIRYSYVPNE